MVAGSSQASFGTYGEGWHWGWGTGVTKLQPTNQGNDTLPPSSPPIVMWSIWYDMIWYNMIWYDMIWYDMIWYDVMWCDVMWGEEPRKSRYSNPIIILPNSHLHILSPRLILLLRRRQAERQAERHTYKRFVIHLRPAQIHLKEKTTWLRYDIPLPLFPLPVLFSLAYIVPAWSKINVCSFPLQTLSVMERLSGAQSQVWSCRAHLSWASTTRELSHPQRCV